MPRRRNVTREMVLAAGLKIASRHGPGGVTHRAIAAELGVTHPTVVWHAGSREQLLLGVVDLALQDIHLPPADLAWEDWLRLAGSSIRAVMLSRPKAAPLIRELLHQTPTMQEATLVVVERLASAGFRSEDLTHAYNMYIGWVVGFTGVEVTQLYGAQVEEHPLLQGRAERIRRQHAEAYRLITSPRGVSRVEPPTASSFVLGLEAILARIEEMRRSPRVPTPRARSS